MESVRYPEFGWAVSKANECEAKPVMVPAKTAVARVRCEAKIVEEA